MRKLTDERREERCISISSALWHVLQSTHSQRGSGAPGGSLSTMRRSQMKRVQIEQRVGLNQRILCCVGCLVETALSLPGNIMSFSRCPCRDSTRRKVLLFWFTFYYFIVRCAFLSGLHLAICGTRLRKRSACDTKARTYRAGIFSITIISSFSLQL